MNNNFLKSANQVNHGVLDKKANTGLFDSFKTNTRLTALLSTGEFADIELDKLYPYEKHEFKLYEGKQKEDLMKSIKRSGLLQPLIVYDNGEQGENKKYMILAGHNRAEACKAIKMEKVPCLIKKNLTKDEIELIVNETNLLQRSFATMSCTEKIKAIHNRMEALRAFKERKSDVESDEDLEILKELKINSKNELNIAKSTMAEYGLSKGSIITYERIYNFLSSKFYKYMDNNRLPLSVAYELSFITDKSLQEVILQSFKDDEEFILDLPKVRLLRNYFEKGKYNGLQDENITKFSKDLFSKKEAKVGSKFSFMKKKYSNYFPKEMSDNEIEDITTKALAMYFNSGG